MFVSTMENGNEKVLGQLREAHEVLASLLEKDELDLKESLVNTRLAETAL